MAQRRARRTAAEPGAAPPAALAPTPPEDTALRLLSPAEREQLGMDSWEPSLLREMLAAENRLPKPKS